ncbi:MAG: arabinan endo-1,5-alpha-L-arabinosidase [Thermoflavifilum sp.]|uniref:arabinan endo-1,5-alpha-L-arabinosidase n=1 Tax=Thermoflavifilum sp. TaxID=1968839 RepID=UPI0018A61EAB|nr:arabinan endo-1,5-alpha-L-arabinosidase [Thermoflavifilum sp.]QOR75205.1 MAG: arabinan endo-1,5-alpha-L-arabinosidase [Thermoflavifilum sp.]
MRYGYSFIIVSLICLVSFISCKKNSSITPQTNGQQDSSYNQNTSNFDINSITDTYEDIADFQFYPKWTVYNVHDPSIKKFGDYYYCYSTDVAYGISVRPGIQIRRSKDLIQWQFVGWAFNGIPSMAANFISQHGGTPNQGIWAPYVLKINGEYRLYFALSSSTPRLSVIELAVSSSPEGPWQERGIVVSSLNDNTIQTNAIDPSVLVDPEGKEWLYYGSAWDGIYILQLDPSTGLALNPGDKGKRIAQRGFTNGQVNGNIEAPEIFYNNQLKKYYLFMSYDWFETKYNVRVGRSDNPDGPFYDYFGNDLNTEQDHLPMIIAPYEFMNQSGWQGTGGCAVFQDDSGNVYMGHNARPGVNKYFMDLHIRKVFWTQDGWPVVSPERYAGVAQRKISADDLVGKWEWIVFQYRVVPGYQNEQVSPDFQYSQIVNMQSNGTFNNQASNTWTYQDPWLTMKWADGLQAKVMVSMGRDWENHDTTILFTGLDNQGMAVWGKKLK